MKECTIIIPCTKLTQLMRTFLPLKVLVRASDAMAPKFLAAM